MARPRTRSTISIETVKQLANKQLARTDNSIDERKAHCNLLEAILFEANAYQGYNDVHWRNEGGYDAWVAADRPDFPEKNKYIHGGDGTDQYRRYYY